MALAEPEISNKIFLDHQLIIDQNADIYGQNISPDEEYDYIFRINVASLCDGNISLLFSNASFCQNRADINNVNINIVLSDSSSFTNWGTDFNNQSLVTVNIARSTVAFQTLQPSALQTIGDRLLEVVAHKLFGHGQARAAINNDTDFYLHDNKIWNNLSEAVSQSGFRHDIYNQYVALGRYSAEADSNTDTSGNLQNDVNNLETGGDSYVNFNFNGLTFDFPMLLNGNMIVDASLSTEERTLIQTGPNVGGTSLTGGVYSIPILVKFHQ